MGKYVDTLETKNLIIRRFVKEDCSDLKEYAIYKTSTGYETWDSWPTDTAGCLEVVNFFSKSDNYWAVCRKLDQKVIGLISFNLIDEGHLDLGHGFTMKYIKSGEDTEALERMISYAFQNLEIVAIDARNEKEWKEQIAPLFAIGLVELEDRMQITREQWEKLNSRF